MFKKTITFTDFNGNVRTEDYYFNLTKAELTEMQLSMEGGIANYIQKIVDTNDTAKMIELFKNLILKSYGIKSEDGLRFIKNDKIREEFSQTEAYSELFMSFATDDVAAAEFINNVIPSDQKLTKDQMDKIRDNAEKGILDPTAIVKDATKPAIEVREGNVESTN